MHSNSSAAPSGAPIGAVATVWCVILGASLWTLASDRSALAAVLCAGPALLSLGLSFTSSEDRGQYQARLFASAGLLPVVLLVYAMGEGAPMWPRGIWVLLAFTLLHVLAFVGGTLLIARYGTALPAEAGAALVSPEQLGARLMSLQDVPVALRLRAAVSEGDEAASWVIALADPADAANAERHHRVLLQIDGAGRSVAVRERLSGIGAPRSAGEASMRGPGDAAFDPARPEAQAVGSRIAQATVVERRDLDGVRLEWGANGGIARIELPVIAGDEGQAWLTLLAAIVTRSGYAWRPRLFGAGGG